MRFVHSLFDFRSSSSRATSVQGFVKEPDMGVCYMPPPTPEELLGVEQM